MKLSGRIFTSQEFKEFQIETQEIGKGGFGTVHKAVHPRLGIVAVKKVKVKMSDKRRMQRVADEVDCLVKAAHVHVVKIYGSYQDANCTYIFMEYCEYDSLRKYIKSTGPFDPRDAVFVLKLLLTAVGHLHRENIIHRDLSAGNILISKISEGQKLKKPFVKICDFGLARELTKWDHARTVCGTPGYIAPEVLNGDKYDEYADVYSLGMVLYLMLTGEDPPERLDFSQIRDENARSLLKEMTASAEKRIKLVRICQTEFVKANSAFESEHLERRNSMSRDRMRSKSREMGELARIPSGSRNQQPAQREHSGRDWNDIEPRRYARDRGRNNLESVAMDRPYREVPMQRCRATSQPARAPHASSSNGESGFESAATRYASSNPPSGLTKLQLATKSVTAQKGWPVIIERIKSPGWHQKLKGQAYFSEGMVTFYPESEADHFEYRLDATVRKDYQAVNIFQASAALSHEELSSGRHRVRFNQIHGPIHSYQDFPSNPKYKAMYYDMVNVVNYVRSKQTKLQLRGPLLLQGYPESFAELMESGDVKVFRDKRNLSDRYHYSMVKKKWEHFTANGKLDISNKIKAELSELLERVSSIESTCLLLKKSYPCLVTYTGNIYGDDLDLKFRPLPNAETMDTASSSRMPLSRRSDNIPVREATSGSVPNLPSRDSKPRISSNAVENTPYEMSRESKRSRTGGNMDDLKRYVYKDAGDGYILYDPQDKKILRRSASYKNTIYYQGQNGTQILVVGESGWPPLAMKLYKWLLECEQKR